MNTESEKHRLEGYRMVVSVSVVHLRDPWPTHCHCPASGERIRPPSASPEKDQNSKYDSLECVLLLYHRKVKKLLS